MAKVIIWPDIYKEQGHWLPCVTLAKTLQDATYTVEFMGIKDCESIVSPYKPSAYHTILESIYPAGYTYENKLEPINQRWKPHHLLPIARGALDNVFAGTNPPNLLVSGYFTALETLLIHYKYQIPFVLITTYLRHPQDDPEMFAKTKLVYMQDPVARKLMDAVLPDSAKGMSIEDFVKPLGAAQEIIPCPKEFDFTDIDWHHRDQVTYVEPMIERATLDGSPFNHDTVTIPAGKRVIFATSGSQVRDYEYKARQFFKALIDMMQTQGMDQYHLVIAAGTWLDVELRREYNVGGVGAPTLPTNVQIFDWVSQLDILGEADVVFMHGGLATIKESIWERVPIIIVPHGKDQVDNALRIRRAGLGLVSEVADLTPTDLRQLLTTATASNWIAQSLASMYSIFHAAETKTPKDSLDVISHVVHY